MIKQGFSKSKFIIFCIICILLIQSTFTGVVYADTIEVTINSTKYSYDTATDTMTVSGGPITEDWKTNDSLKGYVNKLKYLIVKKSSTSVGNNSFRNCSNLEGITFKHDDSSGNITIGDYAFYNCTKLKFIRHNSGEQTTSVNFTAKINSIGNYAFAGCTSITKLRFGTNVRRIGDYAFYGCTGLCYDNRGAYASITMTDVNNTPDNAGDDTETQSYRTEGSPIQYPTKCYIREGTSRVGTVGVGAFMTYANLDSNVINSVEPNVTVSQSASWFNKDNGIASVTLNATATPGQIQTAKDYLIIVDTSNSMNESIDLEGGTTSRLMDIAKSSVCKFIDAVAEESSSNRIAIVSMGAFDDVVYIFWRDCSSENVTYIKDEVMKMDISQNNRCLGESAGDDGKLDSSKGIWYGKKRGFANTRFGQSLVVALRLINIKGTSNPVYTMFFSDGEPSDHYHTTTDPDNNSNTAEVTAQANGLSPYIISLSSVLQSMSEQSHVFFMGDTSNKVMQACGSSMSSSPNFWTIYPKDADLQNAVDRAVADVFKWSLVNVLNTAITQIYNNEYWELHDVNGLVSDTANSKVSIDEEGIGENGVSYTYYLKLKPEKWAMYNENVPVSNYIDITYETSKDVTRKTVQNTTLHTLPWELPYGISYSKGDTNQ